MEFFQSRTVAFNFHDRARYRLDPNERPQAGPLCPHGRNRSCGICIEEGRIVLGEALQLGLQLVRLPDFGHRSLRGVERRWGIGGGKLDVAHGIVHLGKKQFVESPRFLFSLHNSTNRGTITNKLTHQ